MHPENARSLVEQRRLEIMRAARSARGTGPRPAAAAPPHPRQRWWSPRRPLRVPASPLGPADAWPLGTPPARHGTGGCAGAAASRPGPAPEGLTCAGC